MTLREWIDQNPGGATQLMFATRVSWATIMRAARGEHVSQRVAMAIAAFTRGKVPISELVRPPIEGTVPGSVSEPTRPKGGKSARRKEAP